MYIKPRYRLNLIVVICGVFASNISAQDSGEAYRVTVTAGSFARSGSVVSFLFPGPVDQGNYLMEVEPGGEPVMLQVDDQGRGWFILDSLSAGKSRVYRVDTGSPVTVPVGRAGVTIAAGSNTTSFFADGVPVLSFFHGQNEPSGELDGIYRRGGYIHPVFSPGGVRLTNHLDESMHPHHYGVWAAWTNTAYGDGTPDFWNVHDGTGRVSHPFGLDTSWEGTVEGGFSATNYYVDLTGTSPDTALTEKWSARVYNTAGEKYHMFDLTLTHTTYSGRPLLLPEYHYGGMAFRGHENWDDPGNVEFLTSGGLDRSTANETRARWSHMGGTVDGRQAGIAVLGHPANFRAPQPVRIHPDIPYFVYAPMQLGSMSIVPGEPYVMRYRYVSYDGAVDPELLNRLWNDYAYPPGVTVTSQ